MLDPVIPLSDLLLRHAPAVVVLVLPRPVQLRHLGDHVEAVIFLAQELVAVEFGDEFGNSGIRGRLPFFSCIDLSFLLSTPPAWRKNPFSQRFKLLDKVLRAGRGRGQDVATNHIYDITIQIICQP